MKFVPKLFSYAYMYLYGPFGLNDIKTVQAYISTNIKWNENIFGSNSAKISCQITVNSEGF